jgi:hypothetical protein
MDALVAALAAGAVLLADLRTKAMPGYVLAKLKKGSAAAGGAGAAGGADGGKKSDRTKKEKLQDKKRAAEAAKRDDDQRRREAELGGSAAPKAATDKQKAAGAMKDRGNGTATASPAAGAAAAPAAAGPGADLKAAEALFGDDTAAPASAAPAASASGSAPPPAPSADAAAAAAAPAAAGAAAGGGAAKADAWDDVEAFVEYLPAVLRQHSKLTAAPGMVVRPVSSFDAAVDLYISHIEKQKERSNTEKDKAAALRKVEKVRDAHKQKLKALEGAAAETERKARLIESNLTLVEQAIGAVNVELARGTDWRDLAKVIKKEKERGNAVAAAIDALKLETNTITLLLSKPKRKSKRAGGDDDKSGGADADDDDFDDDDDDDDDGDGKAVKIDVNLSLSGYQNAQTYFASKKKAASKATKTIEASAKALKAAEAKTSAALKAVDVKARIQQMRKVHWFERFHYFISSENYLVIGGRDAQQNEAIVKRYLKPNDIYMHADIHGASSVVIKNPHGSNSPIPPRTLTEAATMTICRSSAWNNKVRAPAPASQRLDCGVV